MDPDPPVIVIDDEGFARGADISWVSEMEHDGRSFRKKDGTQADILEVLKDCGFTAIRLRVWVDPYGGWSGKNDVVALSRRVSAAGMSLMVDFHYSDFFADPSRQQIPAAWDADKDNLAGMCTHVADHTKDVLQALKTAGVDVRWVQVGNETRNGMLWPAGQLWTSSGDIPDGYKHLAELYNAGYKAAKAVYPNALVMPHLNNAYEDNDWWFKRFKAAGANFDAIALSHYPQAESGMTAAQYNQKALNSIRQLHTAYGVPVIVSALEERCGRRAEGICAGGPGNRWLRRRILLGARSLRWLGACGLQRCGCYLPLYRQTGNLGILQSGRLLLRRPPAGYPERLFLLILHGRYKRLRRHDLQIGILRPLQEAFVVGDEEITSGAVGTGELGVVLKVSGAFRHGQVQVEGILLFS